MADGFQSVKKGRKKRRKKVMVQFEHAILLCSHSHRGFSPVERDLLEIKEPF